jgi:hypothetical protein
VQDFCDAQDQDPPFPADPGANLDPAPREHRVAEVKANVRCLGEAVYRAKAELAPDDYQTLLGFLPDGLAPEYALTVYQAKGGHNGE